MLIVSVKSRDPSKMGADSEARATSWINTNVAAACRQIDGTIRTLRSPPDGLVLSSMRGVDIPWVVRSDMQYRGLVVINYAPPPGYVARPACSVPTAVLQILDWEFINATLWSTMQLLGYMRTRETLPPVPLVAEKDLFAHVIEAEQAGTRIGLPGGLPIPGKWDEVVRRWPDVDMRRRSDAKYAYIIDKVMAAMARDDLLYSNQRSKAEYLELVRILDEIPVLERVEVGIAYIERAKRAQSENRGVSFLSYPSGGKRGSQIVFFADPRSRIDRVLWIGNQSTTRHAELLEETGYADLRTLGIATAAWPLSGGSHDFVFMRGDTGLTPDEVAEREEVFLRPKFPGQVISTLRALAVGDPP